MKLNFKFVFILALLPISSFGQYHLFSDFGKSAFVDIKSHVGNPIVYSDSLDQSLRNTFWALDYRFGINSHERMPQDAILNFPNYGLGFTHYQMSSDSIGNPMGFYGFFASPLFHHGELLHIGFEIAAGFSFNFNTFHLVNNPKNDLIGSNVNVYFNLSLWYALKLSERLDALASVDFTHFSNGTMNTPNKGLNLYGANLGLRYHFQFLEKKSEFKRVKGKHNKKEFSPYYELATWFGFSGKAINTPSYDGPVYFTGTLSTDFNRRYGWIGKYGLGLDVFYDYSLINRYENRSEAKNRDFTFIGIHGNHEFIVGDVALILQIGTYLWKGSDVKGNFFIRTGLNYDLGKHSFLHLSLKSQNGLKADYIELGMGFRLGKPKATY